MQRRGPPNRTHCVNGILTGGGKMKRFLRKSLLSTALLFFVGALTATASAQNENRSATADEQTESRDQMGMGRQSPEMREMARAMKSMADMCQMMMEKEKAFPPYMMIAGAVLGALLVLALVLFIILEVQWIRSWNLRIKSEQKHLAKQ